MRAVDVVVACVLGLAAGCAPRAARDINAAPAGLIAALPGLTVVDAERVVAHRPYYTREELIRRGILDSARYEAIVDDVYVGPPAMPEYLGWVPPQAEGP